MTVLSRPQPMITYDGAQKAIAAAVAFASTKSVALSFAVVDAAGNLVAAARMDGAPFITIDIARGKAFASVAAGGQSGATLAQRYKENPMVWGNAGPLGHGAPLLPSQGAQPIFLEGSLIGAMGASGAPSAIDEEIINHAIEAIGGKTS
jgi:glc operon protein GlcG